MKTGIWILAVVAVAFAEKPGSCPVASTSVVEVISQPSCVSDFDCMDTQKCCGSMCTPPECDLAPVMCLVQPCTFATCSNIPGAKCYSHPCSATCEAVWFLEDRDVTEECDELDVDEEGEAYEIGFDDDDDDDDDDEDADDEDVDGEETKMPWKERKARRKAKKQAFLQKLADKKEKKMEAIEDKRAAKIEKWESKGKQGKVERFQEKWTNKDAKLEERQEEKKANKLEKKQERKQEKKEWRQLKKQMSPEELEAHKAEKKANKEEKQQMKTEMKTERKEKRKEMLEQKKQNKKEMKNEKMANKWRARKERKQKRKMMRLSQQ